MKYKVGDLVKFHLCHMEPDEENCRLVGIIKRVSKTPTGYYDVYCNRIWSSRYEIIVVKAANKVKSVVGEIDTTGWQRCEAYVSVPPASVIERIA